MMSSNPVIGSRAPNMEQTLYGSYASDISESGLGDDEKWPIWARLAIIVGLSAGLWALIILGIIALF